MNMFRAEDVPGPSGPSAVPVPADGEDTGDEFPILTDMGGFGLGPADSDDSESEDIGEPGRDYGGGSEDENEEEEAGTGTPDSGTHDWKEVRGSAIYELEDFTQFVGVTHSLDLAATSLDFFQFIF
jgi:hypothetical protein